MIEESNIQWHIIGPSLVVEIDRLKAALEQIADAELETWTSYCSVDGHHNLVIKTLGNMPAIARAALRKAVKDDQAR